MIKNLVKLIIFQKIELGKETLQNIFSDLEKSFENKDRFSPELLKSLRSQFLETRLLMNNPNELLEKIKDETNVLTQLDKLAEIEGQESIRLHAFNRLIFINVKFFEII